MTNLSWNQPPGNRRSHSAKRLALFKALELLGLAGSLPVLALSCGFLPACSTFGAETLPPSRQAVVLKDLAYKSGDGLSDYEKERCKLDLYLPARKTGFPTIVWFHGGALQNGSKEDAFNERIGRRLAQMGLAVAMANYRLSPKATYPAYIEDAAAAFAWVHAHVAEHGGDSRRVFVGGHSAGGYLTLMIGLDARYLRQRGLETSVIAGLIPFSGQTMTHYTIREERGLPRDTILADEAAPVHYARKDAPPMLVVYAEKDLPARVEENQYLVAALKAAGDTRVSQQMIPGRDHGSVAGNMAQEGDPAAKALLTFVESVVSADAKSSARSGDEKDYLVPAVECRERGGLPNFLARLKEGGEVRIAYLGGSITAQDGWRTKTLNWFKGRFPNCRIDEINAAIGGTGSDLGVFRLRHDVLEKRPNLLFVEFAVNDGGAAPEQIYRCMEGIVRQTWRADPTTDICFVYTLAGNMLETLQGGKFPRAASAMERIADHYGIPSIHMGLEVARLAKAGKLVFKGERPKTDAEKAALGDKVLFSPDAVHPYVDTGHQLYLDAVIRSFAVIEKAGRPGPHVQPPPFVADNWEAAVMVPLSRAPLSAGWTKLMPGTNRLAKAFGDRLPELWQAREPGESISFRFRGTTARIYDLLGPDCGQVTLALDGQPPVVQPRFDAYCTYHRLATLSVGEGLSNGVHTVKLTVHPEQPDKAKILSQRGEKIDDPKRFDGTAWYAGGILLVGELVE